MPFLADIGLDETSSRQYLRDLFASVVIKVVMKRNRFRDVDLLEWIIAYVMANIGRVFSATSISKFFKNEKQTLFYYKYLVSKKRKRPSLLDQLSF